MLTNLSLFSGAGGLDIAAKRTGKIKTVAYVESDPYAQGVLMSRMRDGGLDDAPIFEDVRTFDGRSLGCPRLAIEFEISLNRAAGPDKRGIMSRY